MSVSRYLIVVSLVTIVALGYVHQQVELLRINYAINCNKDNLSLLLDQNSALRYNVNNLQSPIYLERVLSAKDVNLEVPSRWYTIGLAEAAR
jgi:cell division protein FtsL